MAFMEGVMPDRRPEDLATLRRVASGHVLFGQYTTALQILKLALWLQSDDPETLKLAGLVAFRLGKLDDVVEICEGLAARNLDVSPDLARCHRIAVLRLRTDCPDA